MSDLHGLLVIDKPAGWTSHDVVARVRRLTGERRVGHAGTLDPAATGVLPLGVGLGTRVLEYVSGADKVYRGTVRLGITTDTDDAEGTPLAIYEVSHIAEAAVRATAASFLGDIAQIPPRYSAIKRAGVPLYRLARAGKEIVGEPRRVRIDRIDVLRVTLPEVELEIACSKGAYIRSLARDLGERLGVGAHLASLRRLRSGPFGLDMAHTLDELATAAASGALPALLLPPDLALAGTPVIVAGPEAEHRLLTGRPLPARDGHAPRGTLARAYGADGAFIAVLARADDTWRPRKVFVESPGAARTDVDTG